MKDDMMLHLGLMEAQREIVSNSLPRPSTVLPLHRVLGRVSSSDLKALVPAPGYDQSTRDGYVIGSEGDCRGDETWFPIEGEIAAGCTKLESIPSGCAYRIMTGAMIPQGGKRVIPQEECCEQDGWVGVKSSMLRQGPDYIRKMGCNISPGQLLVSKGKILAVDELALLAGAGYEEVPVFEKPNVTFFCSGSELVSHSSKLKKGKKVSTNRYLLENLVSSFGGIAQYLGVVEDRVDTLERLLGGLNQKTTDILISTGGLGGSKYDLLKEAFCKVGGELIYDSLDVRPGKATLFGKLGRVLYFGLPGPPPAVRTLFHEIVCPALLAMQGAVNSVPRVVEAYLQEPISLKMGDVMNVRAGKLYFEKGRVMVRACSQDEFPTAFILLPPGKMIFEVGELLEVHPVVSPMSIVMK